MSDVPLQCWSNTKVWRQCEPQAPQFCVVEAPGKVRLDSGILSDFHSSWIQASCLDPNRNGWRCLKCSKHFKIISWSNSRNCTQLERNLVAQILVALLMAALYVTVSGVTFFSVIMESTDNANDHCFDFSKTLMTLDGQLYLFAWKYFD